jgi:hypothetical protein
MKRSPLKRKTPLKRGGKLRRVSAKRKGQNEVYKDVREKFLTATTQSAKCADARWRAKFTIGEEGLAIG